MFAIRHRRALVAMSMGVALTVSIVAIGTGTSASAGSYGSVHGSHHGGSGPPATTTSTTKPRATTTTTDPPPTTTDPPTTTTTTTDPPSSPSDTAGFGQPVMDPPAGYSTANRVWDDRFQGTTLDSTHWSDVVGGPVPIPQWGNCCGTPIVNNGLTLTNATNPRSNVDTSNPATGKVLFHFPTGGFFVQFRFKVTDMSHGFWPALWFPYDDWTTQSNEPKNGNEIDMFEGGMLGGACSQADINSCVEFNYGGAPSEAASGGWDQGFYNVGYDITQNFVTMGVEFIPGQHAKFYVNGKLVLDDELGADMAAQPNYNLQITPQGSPGTTGWHTNGPGTGSMYISEVQVYSLP